jgi:hypothetical protein
MFQTDSHDGFSLKAYKGSEMTLLAMDLEQIPDPGTFAGFTIYYTNPYGKRYPIQNLLNFKGTDLVTGSDVSPIQLFKWVHFPGSYQQTGMLSGEYTYEATPRYFDDEKKLIPLDDNKTVKVKIEVEDFTDGNLTVGFTRGFIKSQAFSNRYGAEQILRPSGDWIFDTTINAGTNPVYGKFSFEDMYLWLGFNARRLILGLLEEALADNDTSVEMFAFDFNDAVVGKQCLNLAKKGRIRMILDNSKSHSGKIKSGRIPEEDDFERRFKECKTGGAEIFRCRFGRYSHCKEIILKKNGIPYKVLTGSTNFSYTGLYINANHVLVYNDSEVAAFYSEVFNACWKTGTVSQFLKEPFADRPKTFNLNTMSETEINVSPHNAAYAAQLIDSITEHVKNKETKSVLFSVMEMGKTTTGSLIPALRKLHEDDSIFTYGITDNSSGEISLYKPGKKTGLLIDAKKANRELPPPFRKEFNLGLAHAIHHKFLVTNFNMESARLYCGSSNLALGGEIQNGDNLLCIKSTDVATVFAIEAFRLTDHYNFRSVKDNPEKKGAKPKPAKLDDTGKWVDKFFDENDIREIERKILA